MISNNELQIFDNFIIDRSLPKHKKEDLNANGLNISFGENDSSNWSIPVNSPDFGTVLEHRKYIFSQNVSITNWFKLQLAKLFFTDKKINKPVKVQSVLEFFNDIKSSIKQIDAIDNIAEHYEKVLIKAKSLNQTALVEKLTDIIRVVRAEASLINTDLNQYVSEKDVVEFYKKVGEDKNLKLTWIKNFGRVIPDNVYDAKLLADEKLIFDNYVIMHYDPQNNGEVLTKKEIEKKKDPILFGVIQHSRKLYYIADWTDEYCNLTLEELVKELGHKVGEINNKSVKTFINKTKA